MGQAVCPCTASNDVPGQRAADLAKQGSPLPVPLQSEADSLITSALAIGVEGPHPPFQSATAITPAPTLTSAHEHAPSAAPVLAAAPSPVSYDETKNVAEAGAANIQPSDIDVSANEETVTLKKRANSRGQPSPLEIATKETVRAALISLSVPSKAEHQNDQREVSEGSNTQKGGVQGDVAAAGSARVAHNLPVRKMSVEIATQYAVRSALANCVAAVEEQAIVEPMEGKNAEPEKAEQSVSVVTAFAVRAALLRAAASVLEESSVPQSIPRDRSGAKGVATRHVVRAALERAAKAAMALPPAKEREIIVVEGEVGLVPAFGTAEQRRVSVKTVIKGSVAEGAGVRADDEFVAVNGAAVAELSQEAFLTEMEVRPLKIAVREPEAHEVEPQRRTMSVTLATKHAVRAALARAALAAGPEGADDGSAAIVELLQETVSRALVGSAEDEDRQSQAIEELTSSFVSQTAKNPWASFEPTRANEGDGKSSKRWGSFLSRRSSTKSRYSVMSSPRGVVPVEAASTKGMDEADNQWSFVTGVTFQSE